MNPLSNETRDHIITMAEAGISIANISKILGVSEASISLIKLAYRLVKEEKWDELRVSVGTSSKPTMDWALNKLGKKLPEKKPCTPNVASVLTPVVKQGIDVDDVKKAVAEAVAESCKGHVEMIDKDQMARIMLALGKITDALAEISLKMEECQKTTNANADNLYSLVTNMNNSVILEMRKRKQIK